MEPGRSPQPHDRFARAVFSSTRQMASFLESFLPGEVLELLDLGTLEPFPASTVARTTGDRRGDLAFRVRFRSAAAAGTGEDEVLLHILFEHQSSDTPLMPFRILRHAVGLLGRWLDEQPEARHLPAVLPIVLHNGRHPWMEATRLQETFRLPPSWKEILAPWLPDAAFFLVDLATIPAEELRMQILAGAALAGLAVLSLKHARDPDLPRQIATWGILLRRLAAEPDVHLAVDLLFSYLIDVAAVPAEEVIEAMRPNLDETTEEAVITAAERLRREGMAKGVRDSVARILAVRFGAKGPEVEARLAAADLATLERWRDRAILAASLDEVFEGP